MKLPLKVVALIFLASSLTTPCFAEEKVNASQAQPATQETVNLQQIVGDWRSTSTGSVANLGKDGSYYSTSGDQKQFKKGTYSISNNKLTIKGTNIRSVDQDWAEWNVELSFTVTHLDENKLTIMADDDSKMNYVRVPKNPMEQAKDK